MGKINEKLKNYMFLAVGLLVIITSAFSFVSIDDKRILLSPGEDVEEEIMFELNWVMVLSALVFILGSVMIGVALSYFLKRRRGEQVGDRVEGGEDLRNRELKGKRNKFV